MLSSSSPQRLRSGSSTCLAGAGCQIESLAESWRTDGSGALACGREKRRLGCLLVSYRPLARAWSTGTGTRFAAYRGVFAPLKSSRRPVELARLLKKVETRSDFTGRPYSRIDCFYDARRIRLKFRSTHLSPAASSLHKSTRIALCKQWSSKKEQCNRARRDQIAVGAQVTRSKNCSLQP